MNTTEMDINGQREALANRLVGDLIASMETLGVWLGLRLGLYAALDRNGPATAAELASAAGIDARYAREWLEQQAVAGVLVTRDATADVTDRRYVLPPPHREVLLDEVSPYFVAPASYALAGIAGVLPDLLAAYRTGAGVPFSAYGDEIRDHIEQLNRPMFINDLAATWLPAVPDLHARLQADPPARVAEIACGAGWASIALAQAYPKVRVDGFDIDEASIQRATRNAAASGVDDRVHFAVRDAADPGLADRYHAALVFEALHDLAHPVQTLAAIRTLLADGGCVIVGDERVAETFSAPGDEVERLMYGFSILHCLPASRTETPSAATGTVLRPATLRAYALEAGFADIQILPIDNDMWRFYRLAG
ncbi:MAG: methyltransferase domain-containing protein [Actinobacteria bacterium]|nr:methyltransferase domain-containing protein [Actinomycetota bacterium]